MKMEFKDFQNKLYNEFHHIKKVMKSCKHQDQSENVVNWYDSKVDEWESIIYDNRFRWGRKKRLILNRLLVSMAQEMRELNEEFVGKTKKVGF